MTCRHGPYDRSCSSYAGSIERLKEDYGRQVLSAATPDAERYEITKALEIGENLVMEVQYPNCAACSFEGRKVMVFLGVKPIDAMHWRRIDPHFRPQDQSRQRSDAPSPAARFPGTMQGWVDACAYAKGAKP